MEPATLKNCACPLQVVQFQLFSPKIYKMFNFMRVNLQGLCELPFSPHRANQAKFGTSAMLTTKRMPANLGKN